jgi:hypothetical protein
MEENPGEDSNENEGAETSSDDDDVLDPLAIEKDESIFPSFAVEGAKEGNDAYNVLYSMRDMIHLIFPHFPNLSMKMDIDSLYAHCRNLVDLLRVLGFKVTFHLPKKKQWQRQMESSRFYGKTKKMTNPPHIRFNKAKRVMLYWYCDYEIGEVYVKGFDRSIHIHLHYVGAQNIKKDIRFTKTQMALINAVLNLARETCVEETKDLPHLHNEFVEFYKFETYYGDDNFRKDEAKEVNEMKAEAMLMLAKNFHITLDKIADGTEQREYWEPRYHGINSNLRFHANQHEMHDFAVRLQKGILFTLNLAGIKKQFATDEFQFSLSTPDNLLAKYNRIFQTRKEELRGKINDCRKNKREEAVESEQNQQEENSAEEINDGGDSEENNNEETNEQDNEEKSQQNSSNESEDDEYREVTAAQFQIQSCTELSDFEEIFGYEQDLREYIASQTKEVTERLYKYMRKAFSKNTGEYHVMEKIDGETNKIFVSETVPDIQNTASAAEAQDESESDDEILPRPRRIFTFNTIENAESFIRNNQVGDTFQVGDNETPNTSEQIIHFDIGLQVFQNDDYSIFLDVDNAAKWLKKVSKMRYVFEQLLVNITPVRDYIYAT